jgi:presequence protease
MPSDIQANNGNHPAGTTVNNFLTGEAYHGFRLSEQRFVKEANASCLYFIHEKSGARLLKIAAADPNKLFNITFKTIPEDDCGTPHILEHSVLNGSKSFPVKSPFDILLKGSLHTFLNAMTSQDHTSYPVASMNETDYFNLMHVYLDAVFKPLMLEDDRILKQEGWHYELPSEEAPLTIKGVVYNEMKGTFSNPLYLLYHLTGKHLFPDNAYGFSSGGHPEAIPLLSQEKFAAFHRKYYHPSNSYILLYGDADLHKELEFIDKGYLSDFSGKDAKLDIPLQAPSGELKVINETYPVAEDSPVADNTYLSISYVANENTDRMTTMAMDLLVHALVIHESAPLRIALQEAGIGKEVIGWFSESQQNVITIIVPNANSEDEGRFREVVAETCRKVIDEGFDREVIEGILNRNEFQLKEGDTPHKGLMYLEMITPVWLLEDEPFQGMEYEKPLADLREAVRNNLLEELLKKYLVNTEHAVMLTMVPEPGLQKQQDENLARILEKQKYDLTETELKNLVRETGELTAYQQQEDTPEALASIPMLQLSDIPAETRFYEIEESISDGFRFLHHDQFTNDIVYTSLYFDLDALPQEYIPYYTLLTAVLGKLNTENYPFGKLDNELNLHTGGFTSNLATFLEYREDEKMMPKLVVSAKSTSAKMNRMTELLAEILLRSRYDDKERLKTLIKRHHARVDANIKQNGLNFALNRANSKFSKRGLFNELTAGVEYYRFITHLAGNFDELYESTWKKLRDTAGLLFNRSNLWVHVTCDKGDLEDFQKMTAKNLANLPSGPIRKQQWKFSFSASNEAILAASQVQFVVKSYDFKKLGYDWNGRFYVLNQVLSTDYLQNQVRVMGGAYGGFSGFAPGGNVYFASYRDPNLSETLKVFNAAPDYLERFEAGEEEMARYVIGTISALDQPKTPSQMGSAAMHYYFEKTTREMLNHERRQILGTKAEDIRNLAPLLRDVMRQDNYCVYGSETKILENENLFNSLIRIQEKSNSD